MTAGVVTPNTMLPNDMLVVKLGARPNLADVAKMPRGPERKALAWARITETAAVSQAPLIALAEQLKASGAIAGFETLVSPNALLIDPTGTGMKEVLDAFGAEKSVRAIYDGQGVVKFVNGAKATAEDGASLLGTKGWGLDVHDRGPVVNSISNRDVPYGLEMIGAPAANAVGADGTGLVFGSIDTGADFTHEAINSKYRGTHADGTTTHDRNWFDFGPKPSPVAKDFDAHGTHTIGTVVGDKIGVAPNAKWISVAGLKGFIDVRLKALQFMQAPTMLDGTVPDPTLAPDVVGMSWWTGPPQSDVFQESIENLVAAGIEPVKSAGNNGPGPETGSAPSQFPGINAIAAVDRDGQIADFSSRGPSPLPHPKGGPFWKPDFAAPGVQTLSSVPGNRYQEMSGTSMAQPHFSGALLALLSKYPKLSHDQIITVLKESATDAGARGRDLEFGWGIINIPAALAAAQRLFPGSAA